MAGQVVGPGAVQMPKGNIYFSMVEPGTTVRERERERKREREERERERER